MGGWGWQRHFCNDKDYHLFSKVCFIEGYVPDIAT
jgi:hypothetical protein